VKQTNRSITYTPRPDATPEGERSALAAAYRFILDRHDKKNAAEHSQKPDGYDGTTVQGDSADDFIVQE
jgi:hypothetical protein